VLVPIKPEGEALPRFIEVSATPLPNAKVDKAEPLNSFNMFSLGSKAIKHVNTFVEAHPPHAVTANIMFRFLSVPVTLLNASGEAPSSTAEARESQLGLMLAQLCCKYRLHLDSFVAVGAIDVSISENDPAIMSATNIEQTLDVLMNMREIRNKSLSAPMIVIIPDQYITDEGKVGAIAEIIEPLRDRLGKLMIHVYSCDRLSTALNRLIEHSTPAGNLTIWPISSFVICLVIYIGLGYFVYDKMLQKQGIVMATDTNLAHKLKSNGTFEIVSTDKPFVYCEISKDKYLSFIPQHERVFPLDARDAVHKSTIGILFKPQRLSIWQRLFGVDTFLSPVRTIYFAVITIGRHTTPMITDKKGDGHNRLNSYPISYTEYMPAGLFAQFRDNSNMENEYILFSVIADFHPINIEQVRAALKTRIGSPPHDFVAAEAYLEESFPGNWNGKNNATSDDSPTCDQLIRQFQESGANQSMD